jgi:hypothetical protein
MLGAAAAARDGGDLYGTQAIDTVDPYIQITGSHPGYSVIVSTGISNTPAPATVPDTDCPGQEKSTGCGSIDGFLASPVHEWFR